MIRFFIAVAAIIFGLGGEAFAQGVPCYTAAQCASIRQQYEQQQAAQAAAIAQQQEAAAAAQRRAVARQKEMARIAAQEQAQREAQQAAAQRQAALDLAAAEAAQRQADADAAEARRQAEAKAKLEAEQQAAAQLAAENSPDNHCKEQKVAGELLQQFNSLQSVQDYKAQAIDIEHLTTTNFTVVDNKNVYVCHGAFVLTTGMRVPGTLSTRINVAGQIIVMFNADN